MAGRIEIAREGRLGIIALDRAEAINALDHAMIRAITETLEAWRIDDTIGMGLFVGNGPRGFCAGGDVRAAREMVLAGRLAESDAFFADEYAMNGLIAAFPKPLVSIAHGVTMGGGIGISGHCRYRVAVAGSRFAMPESAIGFVCDVGVNAILAKAPLERALPFLMSGITVGPADALALGLADLVIAPDRIEALRTGIVASAAASHPEDHLRALLGAEEIDAGNAQFCAVADRLAGLSWESAEGVVAAIAGVADRDPDLRPLAQLLETRSPTSLMAIHTSQRAARRLPNVGDVLEIDLRLAHLLSRLPDFAEGVRAVLVDKDQRPKWSPPAFDPAVGAQIRAVVEPSQSLRASP